MERQKAKAIEAAMAKQKEIAQKEKKVYQYFYWGSLYLISDQLEELKRIKDAEKRVEILEKQQENIDIVNQQKEYEEAMKQIKNDNKEFKKLIGETYKSQLTEQQQKEILSKKYVKEQEAKIIECAKNQLAEEKKRYMDKRIKSQKEIREEFLVKQQLQIYEKQLSAAQREEYKKMVLENAEKELQKEREYHEYYEKLAKKLDDRAKIHEKEVVEPEKIKEKEFLDWVRKNEEEYQKQLKEMEKSRADQQKNVFFMMKPFFRLFLEQVK